MQCAKKTTLKLNAKQDRAISPRCDGVCTLKFKPLLNHIVWKKKQSIKSNLLKNKIVTDVFIIEN